MKTNSLIRREACTVFPVIRSPSKRWIYSLCSYAGFVLLS